MSINKNLDSLFRPESIAVVGATPEKGKVGYVVTENIIKSGYGGKIYPVNPKRDRIMNIKSYPDIKSLPEAPELCVVIIPAKFVPDLALECGEKGTKAMIVISAGFKETGIEGGALERQLAENCKKQGITLLGPNCLGLLDMETPLNATFADIEPVKGSISFISQSGALCTAALGWSRAHGIGFSKFVSIGNKADVDETDLFEYFAEDSETKAVSTYIEGVGDGARFINVSKRCTRQKPIVVFKSGVTGSGAKAVSSHTGTLAGSENAYITAFDKCGLVRARNVVDLIEVTESFCLQPVPKGKNTAIITNAGGPGIITTDAIEHEGLMLAGLSSETVDSLREVLPPASNFYNPIDVLGDAGPERYAEAAKIVLKDSGVDALIFILTPQAMTEIDKTANEIVKACSETDITVMCVFMGGTEMNEAKRILRAASIPILDYPEKAVEALSSMVKYGEMTKSKTENIKSFDIDPARPEAMIKRLLDNERLELTELEAKELFEMYGIKTARSHLATNLPEAIRYARDIGYPVVIKIVSQQILHKSDVGGVIVGINNTDDLVDSYEEMTNRIRNLMPNAKIEGVTVQEMLEEGHEFIIGMNRDPQFGPLIMVGLGGVYVEVLKDISFGIAPLTEEEISQMLSRLKSFALLKGYRGKASSDREVLADVISRISQMVCAHHNIMELDLNPIRVYEKGKGCIAADARIILGLPAGINRGVCI